jgi:GNAT superfamily N-acetyltransferase
MLGELEIKQFELAEQDALLQFLRAAYPDDKRKSETAYWRWHYLENPYASPNHLPIWIVKNGERILGQAATIPVELQVGEEVRQAIWVLDFYVDEECRGKGLGKRLLLAPLESYKTHLALGLNAGSIGAASRVGYVSLGHIRRYHRLLYPGEALGEVSDVAPLRHLLNLGYAPFRPRLRQETSESNLTLREVTSFDDSFDDLWQRARVQWPCAVVRSARFLEWQYMKQPGKRFDVLGLYENERLMGYVVMFFRKPERGESPPKAAITDLCYDALGSSFNVVAELLTAALRMALEKRAGSLVTDVLDHRVEEELKRLGFWRIKNSPPFMANSTDQRDLLYEQKNWFLTRGDSDVSIFEQANL